MLNGLPHFPHWKRKQTVTIQFSFFVIFPFIDRSFFEKKICYIFFKYYHRKSRTNQTTTTTTKTTVTTKEKHWEWKLSENQIHCFHYYPKQFLKFRKRGGWWSIPFHFQHHYDCCWRCSKFIATLLFESNNNNNNKTKWLSLLLVMLWKNGFSFKNEKNFQWKKRSKPIKVKSVNANSSNMVHLKLVFQGALRFFPPNFTYAQTLTHTPVTIPPVQ